ncbi:hypothetical protein DFH06DRAFT_1344801 [Mycena polygramma]|nr:hypothetical protein DFH06DRAFT_1344801 [Mycena polygramma]
MPSLQQPIERDHPSAVLDFMLGAPLACVCALMLILVWERFKLTLRISRGEA